MGFEKMERLRKFFIENNLTLSEVETAMLLFGDHTINKIADKLFITDKCVKARTTSIYKKLRIQGGHSKRLTFILLCYKVLNELPGVNTQAIIEDVKFVDRPIELLPQSTNKKRPE